MHACRYIYILYYRFRFFRLECQDLSIFSHSHHWFTGSAGHLWKCGSLNRCPCLDPHFHFQPAISRLMQYIYIHIIHTCVCITYIIYTCVQSDRYRFVIIYMCMLHIVSYHSTWVMICIEISGNPEVPQGWGWTPGCFFQLVWRPGQEPWRREMGRKEGSLLRPHHSHFCLNLVYHCPQAKFSILKYS